MTRRDNDRDTPRTAFSSPVPILFGFSAFLLAAGLAGPLSPGAARLLTVLSLLALAAWSRAGSSTATSWRAAAPFGLALLPAAFALAGNGPGHWLQIAGVLTALGGMLWLGRETERAPTLARLLRAATFTALVLAATQSFTAVWQAFDVAALAISGLAGWITGSPLVLGPTFAGLWVLSLYTFLVLPGAAAGTPFGRRALHGAAFLGVGAAALVVTCALLGPFEAAAYAVAETLLTPPEPHHHLEIDPGALATLGFVLPLGLLFPLAGLFLRRDGNHQASEGQHSEGQHSEGQHSEGQHSPAWVTRPALVAAGAALAAGAGLLLAWQPLASESDLTDGPRVAFHDRGMLDFSRPDKSRYGLIQVGMFGSLRDYLGAAGYRPETLSGDLDAADLEGLSALVVINPRQRYSESELAAVWDYVDGGGGLMVLGDHTDLSGIMDPLNHLLAPVGVSFAFDSAFPLRSHWRHVQAFHPHPVTAGLTGHRDTRIGTGGSLTLAGTAARPVIVGRYAFNDYGNRANDGQGGFLGDYRYQAGERLGDVVLVASADYGDGRVVVFGDTSSFQSLYAAHAYPFLERTFRYTASGGSFAAAPALALLLLTGAVLALLRGRGGHPARRESGALGVALGLALPLSLAFAAAETREAEAAPLTGARVAVVDSAHVGRAPAEYWEDDSMGGLFAGLYRTGYLPLMSTESTPERLNGAALAAYVSPVKPPSRHERRAIERLLERGGTLLVAAGAHDRGVADQFLEVCGLRLANRPLGPAILAVDEPQESRKIPVLPTATGAAGEALEPRTLQFVDAWPVEAAGSAPVTVHAAYSGETLVAETRVGAGRCLAIGDDRFFEDKNLEGEYTFQRTNVEFFEALLEGRPFPAAPLGAATGETENPVNSEPNATDDDARALEAAAQGGQET